MRQLAWNKTKQEHHKNEKSNRSN